MQFRLMVLLGELSTAPSTAIHASQPSSQWESAPFLRESALAQHINARLHLVSHPAALRGAELIERMAFKQG